MKKKVALIMATILFVSAPMSIVIADEAVDEPAVLSEAEAADEPTVTSEDEGVDEPAVASTDGVTIDAAHFPDAAFRSYISANLDADGNGVLDTQEIEDTTVINVEDKGISSLEGIQYFTALVELLCRYNDLSTLDVSSNTKLGYLGCAGNSLGSLDVSSNTELWYLDCDYCDLTELDLSSNAKLTRLFCAGNYLCRIKLNASVSLDSSSTAEWGEQTRKVYAVQSGDEWVISLTELFDEDEIGNIVLDNSNVSISGNYFVLTEQPETIRYTYIIQNVYMGVTLELGYISSETEAQTETETETEAQTEAETETETETQTEAETETEAQTEKQTEAASQTEKQTESGTQTESQAETENQTETSVATGLQGLAINEEGVWNYYTDDQVDTSYSGIAEYNGGRFFVANGILCSDANGLNLYEDKWYFLANGQIQEDYTGLALYDGEWFYITEGVLDIEMNGLVLYDEHYFLVAAGRLLTDYNGLWLNSSTIGGDDKWYFIAAGMVQNVSQIVEYGGEFFIVENGVLASEYNGIIEYDGVEFIVVNGQLYES